MMRTKNGPRKVTRPNTSQAAEGEATKRKRGRPSKQDCAQTKADQSKRAPKKRRAQESVAQSLQSNAQAAKERKSSAGQRQMKIWPTMRDGLDIDFEHWDAAEIAQQWNTQTKVATGGGSQDARQSSPDSSFFALTGDDMGLHAPGPCAAEHDERPRETIIEEIARAAFRKRKSVAIPDDELAWLGLSTSSSEAPEAAQLFWADEELMAIGDGRFYPCRYVREEGDMPVAEWMQKEAQGLLPPGDYEVTAVVDERRRGRGSAFIVKWKGFELNPGQWLPRRLLANTKAMQGWVQKRAASGQWHASSHAERACRVAPVYKHVLAGSLRLKAAVVSRCCAKVKPSQVRNGQHY